LPPEVPGLLRRYPELRVLVTSIAPLSEHVVPLVPLDVDARDADSVRLLVRRIQALDPGFRLDRHTASAVAEVCRWCDGHPGALEQAGTWCGLWSVDEVVRMLPAGLPDGRGDLTAAVGRSLLALSAAERRLLTRLTAIPGSWTVGEAAAVTRGDPVGVGHAVHALLRAGLVRRTGPARFQVLELVRCRWAQPRQATA
jgi:predicted ATPase